MKKLKKIILIGIILLGATLVFVGCIEKKAESQNIQACEHDWVISSKYSFLTGNYKTVSKCSKCGRVIK